MDDTWLVVGLGNPGTKYEATRHNAGARTVEYLARTLGIKMKSRPLAWVGEGRSADVQLILARPKTYMNESGRAVASIAHARKLEPGNLIVLHDEIDLSAGSLRIKMGGGSAGNKGVRSVAQSLGTPEFYRIRIGVGRGSHFQEPAEFVLERIAKKDLPAILELEKRAADATMALITDGLAAAQNEFNYTAEADP